MEDDIIKCIHFVNKIKEHRKNKIKTKQIDKLKHLFRKSNGYLYNFGSFGNFSRHTPVCGQPQNTANGQNINDVRVPTSPSIQPHQQHPLHPEHPLNPQPPLIQPTQQLTPNKSGS